MRRIQSHMFSEKALAAQEPLVKGYVDLLIFQLHEKARKPETDVVNMVQWYKYVNLQKLLENPNIRIQANTSWKLYYVWYPWEPSFRRWLWMSELRRSSCKSMLSILFSKSHYFTALGCKCLAIHQRCHVRESLQAVSLAFGKTSICLESTRTGEGSEGGVCLCLTESNG